MGDIFNYLYEKGNLGFETLRFNEIDSLIMSRISYLPLENVLDNDEKITIKEAYTKCIDKKLEDKIFLMPQDRHFFEAIAESERFAHLNLIDFINNVDYELEQQFSAVTIEIDKECNFISYRGTDNTFVGWKEDFNMMFMKCIPSQREALKYLNIVGEKYDKKIILGGHSKGGNLAIYSAMNTSEDIQNKIIAIYNNDGPGFLEEVTSSKEYQKIANLLHTYIPQTSIIGRLLNYTEDYKVIKSKAKHILQHDIYSWQLNNDELICLEKVDNNSEKINKIINEWLNEITLSEREKFINLIYSIVISTNITNVNEIDMNFYANAKNIINSYKNINTEDKKTIKRVMKYLLYSVNENLFINMKELESAKT